MKKNEESDNQRLYYLAEIENIKKRYQKEKKELEELTNKKILIDIMFIYNDLRNIINRTSGDMVEPLQLVDRNFLQFLKKYNVEIINPLHKKFNPKFHDCVTYVHRDDIETDCVFYVMSVGFKINEKVILAAKVIINK